MRIATVLSTHENSEVYRDTLESVRKYLSDDVVVLIDGFGWNQFHNEKVDKIEGFRHGKFCAPVRNTALGLMGAWDRWGETADWYCYIEYDCLVGSRDIERHLGMADERGYWLLGNDLRSINGSVPELERFCSSPRIKPHSFLGCCLFFSRRFMLELSRRDFFAKFLHYTNFFSSDFKVHSDDPSGEYFGNKTPKPRLNRAKRPIPIHDSSEVIYPSLAVHYGGSIEQLAQWNDTTETWSGNSRQYPMRFFPDLYGNDPFQEACVMHPLKDANSPIRAYHKSIRKSIS
jgi:hypothetical protein